MKWPRVRARRTTTVSPWMSILAREVEFSREGPIEIYHAVEQADYIAIVALTPDGKIPIVRQFRRRWKHSRGSCRPGWSTGRERPADCARRELLEETGFATRAIHPLGCNFPCTGRLSNRIHSFFVATGERLSDFPAGAGLADALVTPADISRLIRRVSLSRNCISARSSSPNCTDFSHCRVRGRHNCGREQISPGISGQRPEVPEPVIGGPANS